MSPLLPQIVSPQRLAPPLHFLRLVPTAACRRRARYCALLASCSKRLDNLHCLSIAQIDTNLVKFTVNLF
uniref:Uncharacterized protein n=1 Tax=Arundo donax TaxID=35708 RepID=A0A0A9AQ93_ARUDO